MAYLNLLPWREAQKKQQQARFMTTMTASCVGSFLLVFMISAVYGSMIEGQDGRNNYLQGEIAILDQRIAEIKQLDEKKKNLQKRIELIAQLQSSRNLGTQIMDEIAKVTPAGVYLTNLEKKGPSLLLVGKSESNNRLSNMIRGVEASELLSTPLLEFIEAGKDDTELLSDFKMHLMVKGFEAVQGGSNQPKPAAGGTK
ncbi:PilN domain-containing protein [Rheinheimera texasensis]|uniref:PilN domain-containing protein n=1 Tax=Rheinheimera texasensis TaxID=306205 RepID=UPI0032B13F65